MTPVLRVKVALLVIGGVLLAYGIRQDDEVLRFVAIGVLFLAFLLRFLPRRHDTTSPPADD